MDPFLPHRHIYISVEVNSAGVAKGASVPPIGVTRLFLEEPRAYDGNRKCYFFIGGPRARDENPRVTVFLGGPRARDGNPTCY